MSLTPTSGSAPQLSLSLPSFQANPMTPSFHTDPTAQLSEEFGLRDMQDVQSRLFMKANTLRNEHERKAVYNHVREAARGLLLKLHGLRDLGATPEQIRQVGLSTLRELETSSSKMMESFARFQDGSRDLDNRYAQFDAKAANAENPLSWAAFSDPTPAQNSSDVSPLMNVIEKYKIKPRTEQTPVLVTVLEKVNRVANVQPAATQAATDRMKQRKTELSRCLLTSMDPESITGAMPCLAKHSKGLSEGEKKELSAAVPNLVAGKALTELAAVPAVASKAVNAVVGAAFKGFVLSAMSEACLEADPYNYDIRMKEARRALNGENPEFNKATLALIPVPVKRVGRSAAGVIQQGVDFAGRVDEYTQKRFYTVPGIVQEGMIGTVELGSAAATGPAIRGSLALVRATAQGSTRVYRAIETAITASRDRKIVAKALNIISDRRPYWSTRVETTAEWSQRMAGVSEILPDYTIGSHSGPLTRFIASLPNGEARLLEYLRSTDGLITNNTAGGIAGNRILVRAAPLNELGRELLGGKILKDLGLQQSKIPLNVKMGKYRFGNEVYPDALLAQTGVQGVSLDLLLIKSGAKEAASPLKKLGAAIAEIHQKTISKLNPSKHYLVEEEESLLAAYHSAKSHYESNGVAFIYTEERVTRIIKEFVHNPGQAGLALDMNLTNFIWNEASQELIVMKPGNLLRSLNGLRWPTGVPAQDFVKIRSLLRDQGAKAGMTSREISALQTAFEEGYLSQLPGTVHTAEALRFYQLRYDLLNTPYNNPTPPSTFKGIIHLVNKFRRDEFGGGKLPIGGNSIWQREWTLISEKKINANGHSYVETKWKRIALNDASEKKIVPNLDFQRALLNEQRQLAHLKEMTSPLKSPITSTQQLFFSDYTQVVLEKSTLKATLLLKVFDDTLLYIHRSRWGIKRLLETIDHLPYPKKFEYVLEEVFDFAQKNGLSKVILGWDPKKYPLAYFLDNHGVQITGFGSFQAAGTKTVVAVEIPVPTTGRLLQKAPPILKDKAVPAVKAASKAQPASISWPVRRGEITQFIKDEAGTVKLPEFSKLPIEKDYYIKLFRGIDYEIVPGGKGSHIKMARPTIPDSPLVSMPGDKEFTRGTAKNLWRIYEQAKRIDIPKEIPLAPPNPAKLIEGPSHNRPLPHRIDYSKDYLQAQNEFIVPKEFNGILSKDLVVVQYHSSEPLHQVRTHQWFMPVCEGNKLCTIEGIQDAVAKLSAYGEITEVTIARVPAGEPVKFLHGRAKGKTDTLTDEIRPGGGVQYRFFDFDLKWIVETRKLPS